MAKDTKYAYQFINHVNHPLLVSAISFWRDSSFPLIINCRGPCQKPTDLVFLLLKTRIRVEVAAGGCRTSYLRTLEAKT